MLCSTSKALSLVWKNWAELYYDDLDLFGDNGDDEAFIKSYQVEKLGHLSGKYKLSNDEMSKYKTSLSQVVIQIQIQIKYKYNFFLQ